MKPEIIKLIEENPDLPVVPLVDSEVVANYSYTYWLGEWGECKVTEYYLGNEKVHFRDEDEGDVLCDMAGCKYNHDPQGRNIYDLTDEEWDALYKSISWVKCIAVYITA